MISRKISIWFGANCAPKVWEGRDFSVQAGPEWVTLYEQIIPERETKENVGRAFYRRWYFRTFSVTEIREELVDE